MLIDPCVRADFVIFDLENSDVLLPIVSDILLKAMADKKTILFSDKSVSSLKLYLEKLEPKIIEILNQLQVFSSVLLTVEDILGSLIVERASENKFILYSFILGSNRRLETGKSYIHNERSSLHTFRNTCNNWDRL